LSESTRNLLGDSPLARQFDAFLPVRDAQTEDAENAGQKSQHARFAAPRMGNAALYPVFPIFIVQFPARSVFYMFGTRLAKVFA